MRMMFLTHPIDAKSAISGILKDWDSLDWTVIEAGEERMDVRVILPETDSQKLVDALQARLAPFKNWRLDIVPLEASIGPKTEDADITTEKDKKDKETKHDNASI